LLVRPHHNGDRAAGVVVVPVLSRITPVFSLRFCIAQSWETSLKPNAKYTIPAKLLAPVQGEGALAAVCLSFFRRLPAFVLVARCWFC
jgi:hypothetical protein